MAITMSGATVDSSNRDTLLTSVVDTGLLSGGVAGSFWHSDAKLAGVTEQFATAVSGEIDKYCSDVETILKQLEAADSAVAFKGSQIDTALSSFIEGVKSSAFDYLKKLKEAEQQIVDSVQKAYTTQDTDLSSNLNSDTSSLSN